MVSQPSPDGLPVEAVERYDVFLSFTRTAPGAQEQTARVADALSAKGLRVFREVRADEFDGITDGLRNALGSAKVLLAHYSAQFPARYACQWELTAAFLAAARYGDPRRRVLAINPEGPHRTDQLQSVELADAMFFGPLRNPADYQRLADRVAARVAAVTGPLGAAPRPAEPTLPAQVLRPRPFVGRYQQLWQLHSRLQATDLRGVQRPDPRRAAMITGLAGSGKTSLAARYAHLYRDAFPGGVFWIGPLGGPAARGDTTGVLAEYTNQLREIAAHRLGLAVGGVEPDRLRLLVADALRGNENRTLWVVDDVPQDLPGPVLDQLLIPAQTARTVLTSRIGAPRWEAGSITLGGLSPDDGLALFAAGAPLSTQDERKAVLALVERCGGHPMVIRGVAAAVRNRRGRATGTDLIRCLREAAVTVTEAVERELRGLDRLATELLRVAAVLAPAPFPPSLAADALSMSTMNSPDRGRLGSAAGQLAEHGLLQQIGTAWEVHPLVCEAVRADADLPAVATRAAAALLPLLDASPPHLISHARLLAGRSDLASALRIGLLRKVAEHYEALGDDPAALAALDTLLTIDGAGLTDLLAAARVGIACGRYETAERQARLVIERAALTDDCRARDRARQLAASALDHCGQFAEAEALWWNEIEARLPNWMSTVEQWEARLALAAARRVRGQPSDALRLLEPLVTELRAASPETVRTGLVPAAKLELARLLQLTGKSRVARELATEVVIHYQDAGLGEHARLVEAQGIASCQPLAVQRTTRCNASGH